jgi:hypothetical protein
MNGRWLHVALRQSAPAPVDRGSGAVINQAEAAWFSTATVGAVRTPLRQAALGPASRHSLLLSAGGVHAVCATSPSS